MNEFGNKDGFQDILEILKTAEPSDELSMKSLSFLTIIISMPYQLYHFRWLKIFGSEFVEAIRRLLLDVPDRQLKLLDSDDIDQMQASIMAILYMISRDDEEDCERSSSAKR